MTLYNSVYYIMNTEGNTITFKPYTMTNTTTQTETSNKVQFYKFSQYATSEQTLNIDNPVEFIKSKYSNPFNFGVDNLKRYGIYKLHGWVYNLKPYMNKYIVKQYDTWSEYYAINKTTLRNTINGKIDKIIDITNQ